MSILDNLNDKQKEAASILNGQTLILAGAGSGKTRTITFKIAHMVKEKGINPRNILALTFTNKAAKEMKERVEALMGENVLNMQISTFHSFAVKLLRTYAIRIGYSSNFNIYDTNDQKTLIKRIIKENELEKKFKDSEILNRISKLKEMGITYSTLDKELDLKYPINREFADIFKKYQEKLEKCNAMDFSDLLTNSYKLLQDEYVLEKIQDRYRYILIDEYQDTNDIQYKIVMLIASKYKNICVVGDEDQSIYSFRGANIKNILNFEKDFPKANIIKLEQNYRSTQNILNTANSIIKNNTSSKGKKLWSANSEGEKVKLFTANSAIDEANFVIDQIKNLSNSMNYKDFCILYRANSQSRPFEESLRRANIPYKIFGGLKFFDRKEIKDIISYLLLINNYKDDISFERVINTPKRSIGPKTIEELTNIANKNQVSLFEAIDLINDELSESAKNKLVSFKKIIEKYISIKEEETTSFLINSISDDIGYIPFLRTLENSEERIENINELVNSIVFLEEETGFLNVQEYLENISLNTSTDNLEDNENYVKLMTIHASKGLEFNIVFLVGVEEGLFPRNQDINLEEEEEERRIFYVAITRAQKQLYITYSLARNMWGQYGMVAITRSRFIDEIDEKYISLIKNDQIIDRPIQTKPKTYVENFNPFKIKNNTNFKIGEIVSHNTFGKGKIKNIDDKAITVSFNAAGDKKIANILADKFLKKEE